jgi:hypothetical protein
MTETNQTIRIKKGAPRHLVFEVLDSKGALLARSTPFASICKLEAGLALLVAAARESEAAVINIDGSTTSVTPADRRTRVRFEGTVPPERLRVLFNGLLEAVVVDDRSPSERRKDLSGVLCDLTD